MIDLTLDALLFAKARMQICASEVGSVRAVLMELLGQGALSKREHHEVVSAVLAGLIMYPDLNKALTVRIGQALEEQHKALQPVVEMPKIPTRFQ